MSKIVVYMPEAPESLPSLDISVINLSDKKKVLEFLKAKKIPLDRMCVVDKKSGKLYVAENSAISSVHDPYTGDQIELDTLMQPFVGSLSLAKDWLIGHSVFLNESGTLCTETGLACQIYDTKIQSWVGAVIELTFGNQ